MQRPIRMDSARVHSPEVVNTRLRLRNAVCVKSVKDLKHGGFTVTVNMASVGWKVGCLAEVTLLKDKHVEYNLIVTSYQKWWILSMYGLALVTTFFSQIERLDFCYVLMFFLYLLKRMDEFFISWIRWLNEAYDLKSEA